MTILFLIRHGQNNWVGKRLAGRTAGVHLNQTGQQQAQSIAGTLAELPFKAVYSSPLERAMETAQPLADRLSLPVQIKEGLSEINFGDWQGKTIKQLQRMKLWKTVQDQPQEMHFPGGESFQQAQQRLVTCVEDLRTQHTKEDLIACFSHSDSIRLLVTHYLAMPLAAFQRVAIDTASISVIVFHEERIFVPFINQIVTTSFSDHFKQQAKKSEKKPTSKKPAVK
ncbi:MAG: hypothetical protein BGO78_03680 [Chloroflexi bacterium 44-23]|nr:MAG: hypothetical protein BGO78_03680 [Chloroflexi bacterium 44-23]